MTVTFFGHRDAPDSIGQKLREVLIHLIEHEGAQCFYVGNEGAYDRLAQALLAGLQKQYSFEYTVVLAYMPTKEGMWGAPTLLPEAAASAPPKFAIERRNAWMISHSDLAVTYVVSSWGGAAKAKRKLQKAGKRILELS